MATPCAQSLATARVSQALGDVTGWDWVAQLGGLATGPACAQGLLDAVDEETFPVTMDADPVTMDADPVVIS